MRRRSSSLRRRRGVEPPIVVNGMTIVGTEVAEMGGSGARGGVKALILVHWHGVVLSPTYAVAALISSSLTVILILPVRLTRIGVHAMVEVGGRNAWLDMPHAEPDLSAALLANLDGPCSRRRDRSVGERLEDGQLTGAL